MTYAWINCTTCEGTGGWPQPDGWQHCPDCEGAEGHIETIAPQHNRAVEKHCSTTQSTTDQHASP